MCIQLLRCCWPSASTSQDLAETKSHKEEPLPAPQPSAQRESSTVSDADRRGSNSLTCIHQATQLAHHRASLSSQSQQDPDSKNHRNSSSLVQMVARPHLQVKPEPSTNVQNEIEAGRPFSASISSLPPESPTATQDPVQQTFKQLQKNVREAIKAQTKARVILMSVVDLDAETPPSGKTPQHQYHPNQIHDVTRLRAAEQSMAAFLAQHPEYVNQLNLNTPNP